MYAPIAVQCTLKKSLSRVNYSVVAIVSIAIVARPAAAEDPKVADIEVPAIVTQTPEADVASLTDEDLDLSNIVRSAVKSITTVQEAPAIVTVLPADEIKDRQFHDFQQIIDTVPGWSRIGYWHSTIQSVLVRGQVQAKYLRDGLSLFDPFLNLPAFHRSQPLESVKRIEVITGPGGVLWGSHSLLGIINVITKDAEDVDGIEVGGSLGDGIGDRRTGQAYVMVGASDIGGSKLKLFAHGNVESYRGVAINLPILFSAGSLPQPLSPSVYGPLTTTNPRRSFLVTLDGKVTYDKLQLRWWYSFGKMYRAAGLSGNPVRDRVDPNDPMGLATRNRLDEYDRYAVLEYRTRFANGRAGVTTQAYLQEFIRKFDPLVILSPSSTAQGGLQFNADFSSYRAGAAVDGDVELARQLRVLYGAEAFYEWKPITTGQSRQGEGTGSNFPSPPNLSLFPLLCPRIYEGGALVALPRCPLTAAFQVDRSVLGVYVNPQYRPSAKVIFDAGARVSLAPAALGSLDYKPNTTVAGAIVWNFVPNWHMKLNYTEGFRPPSFNSTQSNGEGVQIGGNPNLLVEQSRAGQAEINARIFKGERSIRELSFRLDGSYTRFSNLSQVAAGKYTNSGDRGLMSAELLGKLYLKGGHRIEAGYTWLRGDTADYGRLHNIPERWFGLATIWSLWPRRLTVTTNLKVTGAAEDANRLVEYRDIGFDAEGRPMGTVRTTATDLVFDRLPPVAEISAGIQYTPTSKLSFSASVFNALYGHAYQPDVFGDYEPHLEYLPNPYEGLRAYFSASLQY